MNKRYLLVIKNNFGIITDYTFEEIEPYVKDYLGITTIIDLEDNSIKWDWEGCEQYVK